MSDIPYNYRKYIDDVTKMTQRGAISSGEQMQSPSSAGSRGLAKTMQFTNNKTQMQLGQEAIAESMVEIRSIMNRIDGVNVPVSEDDGDERAIAQMKTDRDSDYLYLRGKEIDQGSIMYKMEDYSDGIFELQSAKYADGTELDEKELEELESTQELIDWVMIDFVSESAVQEDAGEEQASQKLAQHFQEIANEYKASVIQAMNRECKISQQHQTRYTSRIDELMIQVNFHGSIWKTRV